METITQEEITKANKWILNNVKGSQAIRISELERGMVVLFLRKVDYGPKRGTELTLDSTEVKQVRGGKIQFQKSFGYPYWREIDQDKVIIIESFKK